MEHGVNQENILMEEDLKSGKSTNGTGPKFRKKVLMEHGIKSGKHTNGTGPEIRKK